MNAQDNNQLMCTLIPKSDQQEKDLLWKELKDAFISRKTLRNGYKLKFKAPPFLLEKMGRFISLERKCCQFLHIRMDVPPPSTNFEDTMEISLLGKRGVKKFLEPALASMGFSDGIKNNVWVKVGLGGIIFSILCCTLPFLFVAFSLTGMASIFLELDSLMWLILPVSFISLGYGLYKKRKNGEKCGVNC